MRFPPCFRHTSLLKMWILPDLDKSGNVELGISDLWCRSCSSDAEQTERSANCSEPALSREANRNNAKTSRIRAGLCSDMPKASAVTVLRGHTRNCKPLQPTGYARATTRARDVPPHEREGPRSQIYPSESSSGMEWSAFSSSRRVCDPTAALSCATASSNETRRCVTARMRWFHRKGSVFL